MVLIVGVKIMVVFMVVFIVMIGMVVMFVGVVIGVGIRVRVRGFVMVRRGRVVRNSLGWVEVEVFGVIVEKFKGWEGGLGIYVFVIWVSIGR